MATSAILTLGKEKGKKKRYRKQKDIQIISSLFFDDLVLCQVLPKDLPTLPLQMATFPLSRFVTLSASVVQFLIS